MSPPGKWEKRTERSSGEGRNGISQQGLTLVWHMASLLLLPEPPASALREERPRPLDWGRRGERVHGQRREAATKADIPDDSRARNASPGGRAASVQRGQPEKTQAPAGGGGEGKAEGREAEPKRGSGTVTERCLREEGTMCLSQGSGNNEGWALQETPVPHLQGTPFLENGLRRGNRSAPTPSWD